MHGADYAVARCLSVRPSVCHTPVYCVKTAEHILMFFDLRVATPFWFFRTKCYGNIPNGDMPNRGVVCKRGMKKIFSTNISLYLGHDTRYDHSYYGMPVGNRRPKLSNGTIFNELERPRTKISRSRHYLTPNISETVGDTGIVTMEY